LRLLARADYQRCGTSAVAFPRLYRRCRDISIRQCADAPRRTRRQTAARLPPAQHACFCARERVYRAALRCDARTRTAARAVYAARRACLVPAQCCCPLMLGVARTRTCCGAGADGRRASTGGAPKRREKGRKERRERRRREEALRQTSPRIAHAHCRACLQGLAAALRLLRGWTGSGRWRRAPHARAAAAAATRTHTVKILYGTPTFYLFKGEIVIGRRTLRRTP